MTVTMSLPSGSTESLHDCSHDYYMIITRLLHDCYTTAHLAPPVGLFGVIAHEHRDVVPPDRGEAAQ